MFFDQIEIDAESKSELFVAHIPGPKKIVARAPQFDVRGPRDCVLESESRTRATNRLDERNSTAVLEFEQTPVGAHFDLHPPTYGGLPPEERHATCASMDGTG